MDISNLGEPSIEIVALKIWVHGRQFEDLQDYCDGNWLNVTAFCSEGGGSAQANGHIIHLGELASFLAECVKLHETLQGKARLSCTEPNIDVELSISSSRGNIEAQVHLTPDHLTQEYSWTFAIDQSYLPGIIGGLRGVLQKYPIRGQPTGDSP